MPKDIKLAGPTEIFRVQVLYDTGDLYGKLDAARTITIGRE